MSLRKGDVLVKVAGGRTKRVKVVSVYQRIARVHVAPLGVGRRNPATVPLDIEPETGLPDGYVKEGEHCAQCGVAHPLFPCCGGNDAHPPTHTQDCETRVKKGEA